MTLAQIFGLGAGIIILIAAWAFTPFREFLIQLKTFVFDMWKMFIDFTQDKPMSYLRYILFLFAILFIINGIIALVLGFQFFCIDGTQPYQPTSPGNGLALWFLSSIQSSNYNGTNLTQAEYASVVNGDLVLQNLDYGEGYQGVVRIQCDKSTPRLTLLGLDIFSYKNWVLLIVLSAIISAYFYLKRNI